MSLNNDKILDNAWHETEKGKSALIKALNERFSFTKEEITPKNENSYEPIILQDYYDN